MFGTFIYVCSFILTSTSLTTSLSTTGVRSEQQSCQASVTELNDKVSDCFTRASVQGLQYAMPYFDQRSNLDNLCRWNDSILECLDEVILPCSNSFMHMLYNAGNFKLVIESVCEDKEYTVAAYKDCSVQLKTKSGSCFQDLQSNIKHAIQTTDHDMKAFFCRLHLDMAECLSLHPDNLCSSNQSLFLNHTFFKLYSLSGCSFENLSRNVEGLLGETHPYSIESTRDKQMEYHTKTQPTASLNSTLEASSPSQLEQETARIPLERSCSTKLSGLSTICKLILVFFLYLNDTTH